MLIRQKQKLACSCGAATSIQTHMCVTLLELMEARRLGGRVMRLLMLM